MNNKNLLFVLAVILIGIIAVAVIDTSGNMRVQEQVDINHNLLNDNIQTADKNS